jgi:hypothetical protein
MLAQWELGTHRHASFLSPSASVAFTLDHDQPQRPLTSRAGK